MSLDISNIDKVELLKLLWKNQKYQNWINSCGVKYKEPNWDKANKAIKSGYIDFFEGKSIEADLSKDFVNPSLYDKNAGKGQFYKCVMSLK